ncbi:MAG: hypothetical protein QG637_491, partial [Chloroflexota bacterium]|nr:hypothetical protein [Chloroflexota bacterium]
GGGRCNVLPERAAASDFVSAGSPNLVRKILAAWPLADVRRFFEADLGMPLKLEAETGKFFPASDRARTVLEALLDTVVQRGVRLRLGARVTTLAREGDGWLVRLAGDETMRAGRIILATGGLSVPATGSDGAGLRMAQALGHTLTPLYPALVPFTGSNPAHQALAGLSLPVTIWAEDQGSSPVTPPRFVGDSGHRHAPTARSAGGFLFTHRGYSGPAVLNISHVVTRALRDGAPPPAILVQWTALGEADWDELLRAARRPLAALLRGQMPERLAAHLLAEAGLAGVDSSQMRRADRRRLVTLLARYPLPYSGHEGYKTAEVTGGGIPLAEVNAATLESRVAPGLYLCGELLDAFGPIGGYNFLWAWVTGRVAGLAGSAGHG